MALREDITPPGRPTKLIIHTLALLKERRASWTHIESRSHHIYRVYNIHDSGKDLLVIGAVDITCRNGRRFTQEFAQNFLLEDLDTSQEEKKPLIRKFQAWIVSYLPAALHFLAHLQSVSEELRHNLKEEAT